MIPVSLLAHTSLSKSGKGCGPLNIKQIDLRLCPLPTMMIISPINFVFLLSLLGPQDRAFQDSLDTLCSQEPLTRIPSLNFNFYKLSFIEVLVLKHCLNHYSYVYHHSCLNILLSFSKRSIKNCMNKFKLHRTFYSGIKFFLE